jgi:hypothetical protein
LFHGWWFLEFLSSLLLCLLSWLRLVSPFVKF